MQSEPDVMPSTLPTDESQLQPRSIASVAASVVTRPSMFCALMMGVLLTVGCSAPPPVLPGIQPVSNRGGPRPNTVGSRTDRDFNPESDRNTDSNLNVTREPTLVVQEPPSPVIDREPLVPVGEPQPERAPDPGVEAFRPSVDNERHLASLVELAFTRLMDGHPDQAINALDQARLVDGWSQSQCAPEVLFWLGQCYDELGERTAAKTHYRQVLNRYPGSRFAPRARERLAELRGR